MTLPIVTAVVDAQWEAGLVAAFTAGGHGITVVRRCVDLPDLLATAASGTARAALLSADLRRLDRDALARLAACGVAVVGLVPPGDEAADRRLRQLGIRFVLAADAAPEVIATATAEAVTDLDVETPRTAAFASAAQPPSPAEDPAPSAEPEIVPGAGRVVAVWGPAGAPGRTAIAVNLAAELARLGTSTLLVDADVYGGTVGQLLGMIDDSSGLAAACRAANAGTLDLPGLAGIARQVGPQLRVLTGIVRSDRWPEVRPAALETVFALARSLASVVVVDCGFCLERDEELSYDTLVPRRNGATLAVLDQADEVLAVTAADPVSLQRFVRSIGELREALPGAEPLVIANRVRRGPVAGDPVKEVRTALARFAGLDRVHPVPYDRAAFDAALQEGRALAECAAKSPARTAIVELAAAVAGVPAPRRRRRAMR